MSGVKYSNFLAEQKQLHRRTDQNAEDLIQFRELLERINKASPSQFYYVAKSLQGTLERFMIETNSHPDGGVSIGEYARRYCVKGFNQDLLESIKDIRIEHAFPAYEIIELAIVPQVWETLPKKYQQQLSEDLKTPLREVFSALPTAFLTEAKEALYRLVSRCICIGEVSSDHNIIEMLAKRTDVWG